MPNLIFKLHEKSLSSLFNLFLKIERSPYNLKHSNTMGCLNVLDKMQWWSPENIYDFKLARLKSLLTHSYDNVPYYRKIFKETGLHPNDFNCQEDLQKLPILTKKDIQDNFSDLIACNISKSEKYLNHTGGSTGEPLCFYQSYVYESWGIADIWRNFMMCGFKPGQRRLFFWGSDYDSMHHKTLKSKLLVDLLVNNLIWINTFDVDENLLRKSVTICEQFKPHLIIGYVSSLTMLAKYIQAKGNYNIRPKAIQTSAEKLSPAMRQLLMDVFQCGIFDRYGCREVGNIAHECEAHEGLHLLEENNIVEFLEQDKLVATSKPGLITVTNLNNYAMPFIRYQIGDIGRPSNKTCSCGRGLALMEMVDGRSTDIIISPSGKLLHGEFFTHLFYKLSNIRQFQVIQNDLFNLNIKIVPMPGFNKEQTLLFLKDNIHAYGDSLFQIHFQIVPQIPSSASGKFRFTISELNLNFSNREHLE